AAAANPRIHLQRFIAVTLFLFQVIGACAVLVCAHSDWSSAVMGFENGGSVARFCVGKSGGSHLRMLRGISVRNSVVRISDLTLRNQLRGPINYACDFNLDFLPKEFAAMVLSLHSLSRLLSVTLFVSLLAGCGINNIPTMDEQVKAAWSQVEN